MKKCSECGKSSKSSICNTCRSKAYRAKYPIKYAYQTLKDNAKRRGVPFSLSFERFKSLCKKTEYHKKKGLSIDSYNIDRKDPNKGYTDDNVQVLTMGANVRKYLTYSWCAYERKMIFKTVIRAIETEDDIDKFFEQLNEDIKKAQEDRPEDSKKDIALDCFDSSIEDLRNSSPEFKKIFDSIKDEDVPF